MVVWSPQLCLSYQQSSRYLLTSKPEMLCVLRMTVRRAKMARLDHAPWSSSFSGIRESASMLLSGESGRNPTGERREIEICGYKSRLLEWMSAAHRVRWLRACCEKLSKTSAFVVIGPPIGLWPAADRRFNSLSRGNWRGRTLGLVNDDEPRWC